MLLAILPFLPLVSFLILILFGRKLSWQSAAAISIAPMVAATAISIMLFVNWQANPELVFKVTLWQWLSFESIHGQAFANFAFYVDALSAVMICVVSGVGLLIHLYAAAYMKTDDNFARFMAYMNLFIVAMLILVLADNLVLLYLGWEGVGLCSFLLIGFWYQDKDNVKAARKAFIVTRIGDTSMAIGLLLIFKDFGQLNIAAINAEVPQLWPVGSEHAFWGALLLLGGAVGKSAQLPLQTWLPDAMAGPTPVSALIHAATMVTAGVYLIARMHPVFLQAPEVMVIVSWIGMLTLLLAGIAALIQTDIKRVLAYSTMSQIGYMMLALGAGAWSAGVFHLMTHAFFKALLFLTAGSIILAMHHQQDIFKMGGLKQKLPFEMTLFAIGLVCLMALPGTSGFFSKEMIIGQLWQSPTAGPWLWWGAIIGALLTSIYSCRLFFLTFLGKTRFEHGIHHCKGSLFKAPLVLLAILSFAGGVMFVDLGSMLSSAASAASASMAQAPHWTHTLAIATPFIGIAFAWFYFATYRQSGNISAPSLNVIQQLILNGNGFDSLYRRLFVTPFKVLARINQKDIIDRALMLSAQYSQWWHEILSATQTGHLRWYLAMLGVAFVCLIGVLYL